MNQVKFVKDNLRPYHPKFFKGFLPQIKLGTFLITLTYLIFSITDQNKFTIGNIQRGLLYTWSYQIGTLKLNA